uniref:F-box domain-containing protein n=1 Tax=Ciona savignyi TaxID=51511 RepID=H2YA03_CIOSA
MTLHTLPEVVLVKILELLDHSDVLHVGEVCKLLQQTTNLNTVWHSRCRKTWLLESLPEGCCSWKDAFILYYNEYGEFIKCYSTIRSLWNKVEVWLEKNNPDIFHSLQPGIKKEVFTEFERNHEIHFPDDYKLFYRIHNGQVNTQSGLFGSLLAGSSNDVCVRCFRPFEELVNIFEHGSGQFPIFGNLDIYSYFKISLSVLDHATFACTKVNSFKLIAKPYIKIGSEPKVHILANSFTEWIQSYFGKLMSGHFPVLHSQFLLYDSDTEVTYTSHSITVSVRWVFLPSITYATSSYGYRVKMSMAEDAPPSKACQLVSRHWIITTESGKTELVNGPGVVGKYPIMRPGTSFSWNSFTSFYTNCGSMKGHFTMELLSDPSTTVNIICPQFKM